MKLYLAVFALFVAQVHAGDEEKICDILIELLKPVPVNLSQFVAHSSLLQYRLDVVNLSSIHKIYDEVEKQKEDAEKLLMAVPAKDPKQRYGEQLLKVYEAFEGIRARLANASSNQDLFFVDYTTSVLKALLQDVYKKDAISRIQAVVAATGREITADQVNYYLVNSVLESFSYSQLNPRVPLEQSIQLLFGIDVVHPLSTGLRNTASNSLLNLKTQISNWKQHQEEKLAGRVSGQDEDGTEVSTEGQAEESTRYSK
ncbi:unnamed protein product [Bursaphelenchus okinawaensis]|uniref:Fatty-acid and retinol-binding protein 1 n=1 Tax=Bursaphelenchus okinawaensis TaxID=465554 RepID=A0A811K2D2_9BILA|nr:unnamed protein product [Bursaphelenchus okinawaensis]CAG9090163.1 unnamed protein product [Bursaphelenchus okinawaensis]